MSDESIIRQARNIGAIEPRRQQTISATELAKNLAISPPKPFGSRYCSLRGNLLLRAVELGSVHPHAMQNDRQLARDGDCGLSEPGSLGEPYPPSL
jgi:hypothetical protein